MKCAAGSKVVRFGSLLGQGVNLDARDDEDEEMFVGFFREFREIRGVEGKTGPIHRRVGTDSHLESWTCSETLMPRLMRKHD
jgi:hypothetical protein